MEKRTIDRFQEIEQQLAGRSAVRHLNYSFGCFVLANNVQNEHITFRFAKELETFRWGGYIYSWLRTSLRIYGTQQPNTTRFAATESRNFDASECNEKVSVRLGPPNSCHTMLAADSNESFVNASYFLQLSKFKNIRSFGETSREQYFSSYTTS